MSCDVFHSDLPSLAIISLRKREQVALPQLCSYCRIGVCVLCFFLTMHLVGL